MTAPRPRLAAALALVLAAAVLAGCSGGDDRSDAATTSSAGPTTTERPPTTAAEPGVAADGPARPSPGCGSSTTGAVTDERRTVSVGGTERWYLLTTPAGHDGRNPVPLVLDFHGLAEGAEVHTGMASYGRLGQQEGFAVAVPQGEGAVPAWKVGLDPSNPDLAFVDALLDQLGQQLCLDTSRVYATGLSNGAFMASTLGCVRADRFAAIAPIAGVRFPEGCAPSRPVPVLAVHGTADPILLFNGGVGDLSSALAGTTPTLPPAADADIDGPGYPEAVRGWVGADRCGATPADTDITPEVLRRTYECPDGISVEFFVVKGGGHSWPGSEFSRSIEAIVGPTNMDLDASRVSWDFFRRFQLPS
ncbi:MAG: alpha/beta hydrolase family esterase [Microthrixaceae bacterium]